MDDLAQIGLVRTRGFTSWMTRLVTRSHWNHCVTRVSEHKVVSAQPTGVEILPVEQFPDVVWSQFPLTKAQANKIIAYSLLQVGKPYGTLTYIAIGIALLLRIHTPDWLERRLTDGKSFICSQLADMAYQAAGIHLFRDERPPGAVTPAALAGLFVAFGWTDKS